MKKVLPYTVIAVFGVALSACSSVSKVTPYSSKNIEVVQRKY